MKLSFSTLLFCGSQILLAIQANFLFHFKFSIRNISPQDSLPVGRCWPYLGTMYTICVRYLLEGSIIKYILQQISLFIIKRTLFTFHFVRWECSLIGQRPIKNPKIETITKIIYINIIVTFESIYIHHTTNVHVNISFSFPLPEFRGIIQKVLS